MVFKAVQGVVPPQGGLRQLWQSSATLNSDKPSAQTLTRSPNLVYKSANVEKWQSIPGFFIESVIYLIKWIRRVEWGNSQYNKQSRLMVFWRLCEPFLDPIELRKTEDIYL